MNNSLYHFQDIKYYFVVINTIQILVCPSGINLSDVLLMVWPLVFHKEEKRLV